MVNQCLLISIDEWTVNSITLVFPLLMASRFVYSSGILINKSVIPTSTPA